MIRKKSPSSLDGHRDTQANISIPPRLVTIKEAASYCSCSVWAIRDVTWSRELPACRIGRRYLIDRGDLDRFIDARLRERS
jgi:excisionase family DNA binding protein